MTALWLLACTLPTARTVPIDPGPLFEGEAEWFDEDQLQVGTFNIEWLWATIGDGFNPRNEVDYEMVGQLITAHDLELVGLQEINGPAALQHLQLPEGYAWEVSESGWSANLAILYDQEVIAVEDVREIDLVGTSWAARDPLVARVTWLPGDLSFTFAVVHFKAGSDREDADTRAHQIEEFHYWLTTELADEPSPWGDQVVIVGDFNDTFQGINSAVDALGPFENDDSWTFATLDTTESTLPSWNSKIDHVLVSEAMRDHYVDVGQDGACHVIAHDQLAPWATYTDGWSDTPTVSDHRPVWVYIR